MKKIICLFCLFSFFFVENCFAGMIVTRLPIRSIASSTHGPSRVPAYNDEVLMAFYDEETSDLTLHYTTSSQDIMYIVYNEEGNVIVTGEGTMGEYGTFTFSLNEKPVGRFIVEVQIGVLIFEGEIDS